MTEQHNQEAVRNALATATPAPETTEQAIQRLSSLSPLEYDRLRGNHCSP